MSPDAFLAFAEAFPEALVLVREDGRMVAANSAAARIIGRPSRDLRDARLHDLTADPERLGRFLSNCVGTRSMIPGRIVLARPDGSQIDCRAEGAVVRPPTPDEPALLVLRWRERGEQDRFRLLNQKIDELGAEIRVRLRLEAEREQLLQSEKNARRMAEQANRLKDEFLATLSHELRTPLNAITGWATMLGQGVGRDKLQKGLDTIAAAARTQTQLIDDLLDVSRIITGKLRLDLRPVNVSEPVQEALDSVEPAAQAKNIRIERLIDPDPGLVSADPGRIQQIVWNLLSNAIKFTPKGGRVQVRVERVNSHVEIIVSDTGEGVGPELLPYIFDRFRQGEGSLTRAHQGLGLGLSIVRHLVEAHGGQVGAFSEGEGQGTTFTVTLPVLVYGRERPVLEPGSEGTGDAVQERRLRDVRVLVVEDEPESREMLSSLLTESGAEVRGVVSADGALEQIETFAPHVVVSDIELRGEDGYMLARKLRRLSAENGGKIPAIALTAYARSVDRVRAFDAGFQMHLSKPVEPAELIAAVATLARGSRQEEG